MTGERMGRMGTAISKLYESDTLSTEEKTRGALLLICEKLDEIDRRTLGLVLVGPLDAGKLLGRAETVDPESGIPNWAKRPLGPITPEATAAFFDQFDAALSLLAKPGGKSDG